MLNRGVNGEETEQMMARFETDVIAAHPDLVLWQVGTNSVLRDHPLRTHSVLLHEGIAQLKQAGADVVLIDMQFAPKVLAKSETPGHGGSDRARRPRRRTSICSAVSRSCATGMKFSTFRSTPSSSPDKLHMNDWSYACVAKLLAAAIADAAARPTASAAVRSQH